jgi:AcrR family transcriptional regulator
MQRVAGTLEVTKMALYRYVSSKAELVAVMTEVAVGQPPAATRGLRTAAQDAQRADGGPGAEGLPARQPPNLHRTPSIVERKRPESRHSAVGRGAVSAAESPKRPSRTIQRPVGSSTEHTRHSALTGSSGWR